MGWRGVDSDVRPGRGRGRAGCEAAVERIRFPKHGPIRAVSLMAIRPLHHPDIASVTVAGILHALADPVRLAIVSELMDAEAGMSCVETMGRMDVVLPKSTCSQHFQILREAGLIFSERRGVELSSRLRYREIEGCFPGLLSSILKAYGKEKRARGGDEPAHAEGGKVAVG
jgi:DNA-binding transcriptional ArsR family regulator